MNPARILPQGESETVEFKASFYQVLPEEVTRLRFQIGTSKRGRGGRRYAPYAFTEQGVAMLSGVLRNRQDNVAKSLQTN